MTSLRSRLAMIFGGLVVICVIVVGYLFLRPPALPEQYSEIARVPKIVPDYQGCVIPPNIAPLNFVVAEEGRQYRVRIYGDSGEQIVLASRDGKITIPIDQWRALLQANRGTDIQFDVYANDSSGKWQRFETFSNRVADEPVDPYIVYRLLDGLNHNFMPDMGTYERHVESFSERPIWVSSTGSCTNCHTFINNDPSRMIMHIRGKDGTAMVLAQNGRVERIDTRTKYNPAPAAFTAWHPSGEIAAFSVNMLQLWHKTIDISRITIDYTSDIGIYVPETNSVLSTSDISQLDTRESLPTWSPDGKYLYFVSGDQPWDPVLATQTIAPEGFREIQYDLMRIGYDADTGRWGELETVLSHEDFGQSITEPRISPDGRFLMFTACQYGAFPPYLRGDLYMLELQTGKYWPLTQANSDQGDSSHSWSTNGRWVVFPSNRRDHNFTKLYFTYIDGQGQASKAFLLPQEDPTYYDSLMDVYNVPEFITGPIPFTKEQLRGAIQSTQPPRPVDAITGATGDGGSRLLPESTTYDEPSLN